MSRLVAVLGAWVLGLALTITSAGAADLALVIGNHDYARAPTAVSAKADAEAVAHALRRGGYDVIFGADLNRTEMRQKLAHFARRVGQADRVVVFYSGLALRADGRSYLAPVDQTNHSLVDVMMDGVPLDLVLQLAAQGSGKAVVFIDGAQLNGYAPHHFAEPGLAHIRPPHGVLLVSAAAPGRAIARRSPGESDFARKVVHDFLSPGTSVSQAVQKIGSPAWVAGDTSSSLVLVSNEQAGGTSGAAPAQAEDRLNLSPSERSQIQQNLTTLGYDTRGTSGVFGRGTRRAIRNWQQANNLNVNGYLTQAQIALISQQATQARSGSGGASAAQVEDQLNLSRSERSQIQQNLTTMGYDTRGTNGAFGPGTRTAIRNWQRANNLNETGYLTQAQIALINQETSQGNAGNNGLSPAQVEDQLNLSGSERSRIQENLTSLGYDTRGTGGAFGPGTRTSIRNWQRDNNHNPTGYLTSQQVAQIDRQAGQGGSGNASPAQVEDQLNLSRSERSRIQENLTTLGYDTRGTGGIFGPGTRRAIRNWQRSNNHDETGYLTSRQVDQIDRQAAQAGGGQGPSNPAATEAALSLSRTDRLSIEQRLAYLGFPPGPKDGFFDSNTRQAIRDYQRSRGYPVTGYLDRQTLHGIVSETRNAHTGIVTGAQLLQDLLQGLGGNQ